MPNRKQLETLDNDDLARYAEVATHRERNLILQIMTERSTRLRHDLDRNIRSLYETMKSYTESMEDDEETLDSNEG